MYAENVMMIDSLTWRSLPRNAESRGDEEHDFLPKFVPIDALVPEAYSGPLFSYSPRSLAPSSASALCKNLAERGIRTPVRVFIPLKRFSKPDHFSDAF